MGRIALKLENGKQVGQIAGDTASIPVTSRNYLGLAKGYSLDGEVLRTIVNAGCQWIDFCNVKSGKVYRVSVDEFQANAKSYNFGYGEKWAAPDSLYTLIAPTSPGLGNLYA